MRLEGGARCIYTRRPADMRMDACRLLTVFSAFRGLGGQFALVYRPLAQRRIFLEDQCSRDGKTTISHGGKGRR